MLPQTHFLFAFLLGLAGVKLGYLSLMQAFITGLIGMLIDLDHVFTFLIIHKEFNLKKAWNAAVIHHEHERTLLHRWPGLVLISVFLIILGNYFLIIGIMIAIGYYTHYVLDHVYVRAKTRLILRGYGFVMKLFYYELVFQLVLLVLVIIAIIR